MPWGKGEREAELGVQRRVRKRVSCYRRGHKKVALGQNPEDCLKEVKDQAAQVGMECVAVQSHELSSYMSPASSKSVNVC